MLASLSNSSRITIRTISSSAFPKSSSVLVSESQHSHYAGLTLKTLQREASQRNLKITGRKAELIERLASNDIFQSRKNSGSHGFSTTSKRHIELATVSHVPDSVAMPMAIPRPWDDNKPELPVRVPFLPENDFARYHRREFVPQVKPPHKPVISTASAESTFVSSPAAMTDIADDSDVEIQSLLDQAAIEKASHSSSKVVSAAKSIFEELFPAPKTSTGRNLFAIPTDPGQEITISKEAAMKTFGVSSAAWWFAGEPIMVAFGIL
ncbi:hypothetical protein EDC01DRAFT_662679 [Geopyxis carbonaria]|nr:hypothetical protein EDC01DRAFT_662679 [Geopyxis carbonaria]